MLKEISKDKAKEYINKGVMCTGFAKDDNKIEFSFVTEHDEERYVINYSERYCESKNSEDIFELFYTDENYGGLDYPKKGEIFNALEKHYFMDGFKYYLTDGNIENLNKLSNDSYLFVKADK